MVPLVDLSISVWLDSSGAAEAQRNNKTVDWFLKVLSSVILWTFRDSAKQSSFFLFFFFFLPMPLHPILALKMAQDIHWNQEETERVHRELCDWWDISASSDMATILWWKYDTIFQPNYLSFRFNCTNISHHKSNTKQPIQCFISILKLFSLL